MKKKSKLKMLYVYLGIIVLLFGGIFTLNSLEPSDNVYGIKPSRLNPATRDLLKDPNYQNIILPAELDKKIADKEDFFVYLFSSTCPYCMETTPKLVPLAQDMNVDLHQFNLLEFPEYQHKMNIQYTPTLAYYKDGVEVERLEGGLRLEGMDVGFTIDEYREFFEKYASSDNT